MRLAAAVLLLLCALATGAEARSVTGHQRSERNLLTSAISGVQHAVGAAVGGVLNAGGAVVGGALNAGGAVVGGALNAGGALAHNVIGVAEGAVVGAIEMAEQLAETLVHHNAFAVRILQCLAEAATNTTHNVADSADDVVEQATDAVADALYLDANQTAAQKRGVLSLVGGAVRDCVVGSLRESVEQLEQQAHKMVGNASHVAVAALETLKQAIEKNVQANSTVLQSLDGAVDLAEEVVKNLTQKADGVVNSVADKADAALDNVSNATLSKRNLLNDFLDQVKASLAEWINNATSVAENKAEGVIAQAEKAADEVLQKAQETIDENLIEGSNWEQVLEAFLQKAENVEDQLASNAEGAVASAVEVAQEIANSISSS